MNAVVELKPQAGALAQTNNSGRMAVADIISHVATVQEVMKAVMKKDVHFGTIPGTDKPTLLKPGAEVLCMAFRIADSYFVEDLSADGAVRYRVTCTGTHQTTGTVLGTGMGEASSGEEKYKWRKAWDEEFNATPANMRRIKTGKYTTKQVRTEPADLANTILKMANKRAKIAMTINVTACGDMFGQDLEDMDAALREHLTRHGEDAQQDQPAAPVFWPEDAFNKQLPKFQKAVADGKNVDEIIAWAETKGQLTEAQKAAIRGPVKAASNGAPIFTYAQVAEKLNKAQDLDQLADAATLISAVADEGQRAELATLHDNRRADLA